MVLTIFLDRIDGSLLEYDMIVFLSGFSGFFSNLQNSMASPIFLHRIDILLIKYDLNFLSGNFIRFPDFFLDFLYFPDFCLLSSNLNLFV